MKTEIRSANDPSALARAIDLLRAGEVIAIPTDTVYGVAADGFDEDAIKALFEVKKRPRDKPIPLLLSDASDLDRVAENVTDAVSRLSDKFWPGPLTLVVAARSTVPRILRAEGNSVAVRVPDHATPRALARALGHPVAATSANRSGGPDPSTAAQVVAQLGGRIPLVLDGGATRGNVPSTVVDCSQDPPRVLRVGALPVIEVEKVLGLKLETLPSED